MEGSCRKAHSQSAAREESLLVSACKQYAQKQLFHACFKYQRNGRRKFNGTRNPEVILCMKISFFSKGKWRLGQALDPVVKPMQMAENRTVGQGAVKSGRAVSPRSSGDGEFGVHHFGERRIQQEESRSRIRKKTQFPEDAVPDKKKSRSFKVDQDEDQRRKTTKDRKSTTSFVGSVASFVS